MCFRVPFCSKRFNGFFDRVNKSLYVKLVLFLERLKDSTNFCSGQRINGPTICVILYLSQSSNSTTGL